MTQRNKSKNILKRMIIFVRVGIPDIGCYNIMHIWKMKIYIYTYLHIFLYNKFIQKYSINFFPFFWSLIIDFLFS